MIESIDENTLAELLIQWEEHWDQGNDASAETICGERTDLIQQLQSRIDVLKRSAWLKEDPALLSEGRAIEPLPTGLLAGRYRIEGLLGEGGHGSVYRAFDNELQRHVAIKVASSSRPTQDLLTEARRVAGLRHPNIVAVHDVGRHDDRIFIVAELIVGKTLCDLIPNGSLSLEQRIQIVAAVADALHYAHSNGFVHRDVKPSNIIIDEMNKPFVTDFGIAATLSELSEGRSSSSGTLTYMSPEQIAGETQLIDHRTDIYSLGVVLFETLTDHLPYRGRTFLAIREQILLRPPTPITAYDDSLSKDLQKICERCLAKHPADRFQSATELSQALRNCPVRFSGVSLWARRLMIVFALAGLMGACLAIAPLLQSLSRRDAIYFDGRTRIVTNVERRLPVSLEAWVRPDQIQANRYDCQFFIGSDIPTKNGIGIAICSSVFSTEYYGGMIKSEKAIFPERWTHVAGVFTKDETRLYVNGELIATGPGGSSDRQSRFVVGNVGELNPIDYYQGRIRAARITNGERYTSNFTPPQQLDSDAETLLSITAASIDGNEVLDANGQVVGSVESLGGDD